MKIKNLSTSECTMFSEGLYVPLNRTHASIGGFTKQHVTVAYISFHPITDTHLYR